jgi:hypothetical protein
MSKKQRRSPAGRTARSPEELLSVSSDLFYEIKMLSWSANEMARLALSKILRPVPEDEADNLNNALLESFTLHARALVFFLYSEKLQDSDVIAEEFASGWLYRSGFLGIAS